MIESTLPSVPDTYQLLTNRNPISTGRRHKPDEEGVQGAEIFMRCVNAVAHKNGDAHPSLRINPRKDTWVCDPCGVGGRSISLLKHAGSAHDNASAFRWLRDHGWAHDQNGAADLLKPLPEARREVAAHKYLDESGNELFEVVRYEPKGFRQRRIGRDGEWVWKLNGVRRVPYHLPELIDCIRAGKTLVVTEGEKDADRLIALGLNATTNAGGTGFVWTEDFIQSFNGAASIRIVSDGDEPGRKAAKQKATVLATICNDVKVVDPFPDRNDGSDLSDYFEEGNSLEDFKQLCRLAKPFEPELAKVKQSGGEFTLAADLLDEVDEEREDLVAGGLIPSGGSGLIVAKPKVGKTTFAYTLALCVARGEPFLDRETKQGSVLYVALEEKKSKLRATLRRMGVTRADQIHFHVGQTPEGSIAWLLQNAERYKPALIVIDTLQRFARLRDVNDYSGVTNATQPLLAIAEKTGAAILWLHHANKGGGTDGDEVLGSTALFGSVDTLVTLRRSGNRRTLVTQQRYGESLEEVILEMDSTTGLVRASGTREEADLNEAERLILGYLANHEAVDAATIREAIECRRSVVTTTLDRLFRAQRITRVGGGKKGDPHLFGLPQAARTEAPENSCNAVPDTIPGTEKQHFQNPLEARQIDLYSVPENLAVPGNAKNHGNSIFDTDKGLPAYPGSEGNSPRGGTEF